MQAIIHLDLDHVQPCYHIPKKLIIKLFYFQEFVKPICLPYDADAKEDYQKLSNEVHVAGWGVTGPRSKYRINISSL